MTDSIAAERLAGAYSPGSAASPGSPPISGISEVLDRLFVTSHIRMGGDLDRPLDMTVECAAFATAVKKLRLGLECPDRRASLATLEAARARWRECRPSLEKLGDRFTRILCLDEATATDPIFVESLTKSNKLHTKRRWLEGLIGVYLSTWRRMEKPDRLEALLRTSIAKFVGRSRRLDVVRPIAEQLFSPDAADYLGREAVGSRRPLAHRLAEIEVTDNGLLGRASAGEALRIWTASFVTLTRTASEGALIKELSEHGAAFLANTFVDHGVLGESVDRLILSQRIEENEALRTLLCDNLLSHPHLGDPRLLANSANWGVCSAAARDKMIRWLSRHDLAFFFDFVMDQTDDPHGRKGFWSRYIDQVADCTVALSPRDAARLRSQVKERVAHSKVTGTDNVSAFLMRFRGATNLIVIEFSQAGNALYVHDAGQFEAALPGGIRRPVFHLRDDLKRGGSMEEWIAHVPGWTYKLSSLLSHWGIRPVGSVWR